MRKLVKVRDAADDRSEMDDVGTPVDRRLGLVFRSQVPGMYFTLFVHPSWRGPLITHPDLVGAVTQQSAYDCTADSSGSAGDQYPVHLTPAHMLVEPKSALPVMQSSSKNRVYTR